MDKFIYTEKEVPQRSELWHKFRSNCIGASDVATVLGLNKYESAHTFWKRRVGKLKPKEFTGDMQRGAEMEDEARDSIKVGLIKDHGVVKPEVVPYFAIHPEFQYIGISYDGIDLTNSFITEIKCPQRPWNFRAVFETGVPKHYLPQVQMQLFVAKRHWGIEKAYFCSYYPDGVYILDKESYIEYLKRLAIVEVNYDAKYCEAVRKVLAGFWNFINTKEWDGKKYDKLIVEFNQEII